MTEALSTIIADLSTPGRFLAFCDETDVTKEPTSTMVSDIHLHAAVIVPSDGYTVFASELAAALEKFGVSEFHAVDIVNNGKKSVWRHREKADRLAALQTICDALCASAGHIYYVHISKAQHEELLAEWPEADLGPDHKTAVQTRFRELIARLLDTATPAAVIADKEKNTPGLGLATVEGGAPPRRRHHPGSFARGFRLATRRRGCLRDRPLYSPPRWYGRRSRGRRRGGSR